MVRSTFDGATWDPATPVVAYQYSHQFGADTPFIQQLSDGILLANFVMIAHVFSRGITEDFVPQDVYYKDVDLTKDHLPDGMRLIVNRGPQFQSLFGMMGIEALPIASVDDPELIQAIADKVGQLNVGIVEGLLRREWVGGTWYGDDMGYMEGLIVSPNLLRRYVFPYFKPIGESVRTLPETP